MDKARLGFIIAFLGSISYFAYENEQLLKEISPVVSDEDATYKKRIEEIADKYNLDLEQKGRKRKFDFDAGHSFHSKEKYIDLKGDDFYKGKMDHDAILKDGVFFYDDLLKDEDGKIIRAIGECSYGKIFVKECKGKEVSIIQEFSNFGKKGAVSVKNNFQVLYVDEKGNESEIEFFENMDLRQPLNNTIKLQEFKCDEGVIFAFIPQYMSSYGLPLYLFGITNKGEGFQFALRTSFDGVMKDTLKVSTGTKVLEVDENMLVFNSPMVIEEYENPRPSSSKLFYKLEFNEKRFTLVQYVLSKQIDPDQNKKRVIKNSIDF